MSITLPPRLKRVDGLGISPEYDADDLVTIKLGGYGGTAGAGSYVGTGNVDGTWGGRLSRVSMEAGSFLPQSVSFLWAYSTVTSQAYYVIVSADGTLLASADIKSSLPAHDSTDLVTASLTSIGAIMLADEVSYYHGIVARRATGAGTNQPGFRAFNADQAPGDVLSFSAETWGETLPSVLTGGAASTASHRMVATWKTPLRKSQSLGNYSGTTTRIWLGHSVDTDYVIQFRGVNIAADNALTVKLQYDNGADAATGQTLVLDMGATDKVTFAGNDVALNAGTPEAGDDIDVVVSVQASTGKIDALWCNQSVGQGGQGDNDRVWFSHARENDDAGDYSHGQTYTLSTTPQWLEISGTATIDAIEVGWQPIVTVGDSQASVANGRLGAYLPDAATLPRVQVFAGISGSRIADTRAGYDAAGYLRYCGDTTPGALCDIPGSVLVIAGYGLNDMTAVGTTEANRDKVVSKILRATAQMICDATSRGIEVILLGLPPYSSSLYASEQEAQAIRQLNRGLHGLAVATRTPFYCPWTAVVEPGTEGDAIPTFSDTYTGDAGTHYNGAGAEVVAEALWEAYETLRNRFDE